ncbi:class I SAM-dependent methyltransferase [Desulfonema ishimotonii]|uniref:Class I SAM-dependent methyltransferase n=1 Tax=Desulfonema ishimotonii TaxID=45657 RepID=A0A401FX31_9BACT|nr:class I SAM-dependent methyltransferase [Desulfonema ishimotonii]GBC61499.1 class I SAM-dependent methyltransferase [Desulfonema ishimotonii]
MKQAELFHPRVFNDEKWAEGYYNRNAGNIRKTGARFASLLQNSGFKSGKILDVGCGFGAVAIELAKTFPDAEITGIDLGEPLLRLGESEARKAGVADRIHLLKGDVRKTEFPTDAYDVVTNTFMLHIVENPIAMLNEIERVTKPEGKIMITDLRRIWMGIFAKKLRTAFTLDEAMAVIRKSALRPGHESTGPFWWDYMAGM